MNNLARAVIFRAAVPRSGDTTSGHGPVWVCEDYSVLLGPFGKHSLLGDEAVSPVGGVFMEKILTTLVFPFLVVMVGDFPIPFCPGKETRQEREGRQG